MKRLHQIGIAFILALLLSLSLLTPATWAYPARQGQGCDPGWYMDSGGNCWPTMPGEDIPDSY